MGGFFIGKISQSKQKTLAFKAKPQKTAIFWGLFIPLNDT